MKNIIYNLYFFIFSFHWSIKHAKSPSFPSVMFVFTLPFSFSGCTFRFWDDWYSYRMNYGNTGRNEWCKTGDLGFFGEIVALSSSSNGRPFSSHLSSSIISKYLVFWETNCQMAVTAKHGFKTTGTTIYSNDFTIGFGTVTVHNIQMSCRLLISLCHFSAFGISLG